MIVKNRNILLALLLLIILVSCVEDASIQSITSETVYLSILNIGLEADSPCLMQDDELFHNGITCRNAQFLMPSIGENMIGNIYECPDQDMINQLVVYIIGTDNYRSWMIVKNNILLKMSGDLPESLVDKYVAAIPGVGDASILAPNMADDIVMPTYTATSTELIPTSKNTSTPQSTPTNTMLVLPTVTNTSSAAPELECNPSYPDVCLKNGIGDYDCYGGSGDGPNYIQGPIRVLPPDPFDLDGDGDGWGCT
jgi:hypothetical protein